MDVFSKNTFVDAEVDDRLWILMSIIKRVKHTVLIFSPRNYTVQPLNSAWILYEIYCTTYMSRSENCKFDIAMSPDDKHILTKIAANSSVESILPSIDCRNSTTFDPLHKIRILYLIETTVGFEDMNTIVYECIRDTCAACINKEAIDSHHHNLQCLDDLAELYSHIGKHKDALLIYEECFGKRLKTLGHHHPDTLQPMNNMATSYEKNKQYDEALRLRCEYLTLSKTVLDENHPNTLQSQSISTGINEVVYGHEDALHIYSEFLDRKKETLGHNHPDTLQSMNSLALLYERMGRHDDALKLHTSLFALRRGVLGDKHEDTLQSMKTVIESYKSKKINAEALFLLKNYIALLEEKLGANHPDTINVIEEMDVFIETMPLDERICVCDVVKSTVGVNGIHSIAYEKLIKKITTDVTNSGWQNSFRFGFISKQFRKFIWK